MKKRCSLCRGTLGISMLNNHNCGQWSVIVRSKTQREILMEALSERGKAASLVSSRRQLVSLQGFPLSNKRHSPTFPSHPGLVTGRLMTVSRSSCCRVGSTNQHYTWRPFPTCQMNPKDVPLLPYAYHILLEFKKEHLDCLLQPIQSFQFGSIGKYTKFFANLAK